MIYMKKSSTCYKVCFHLTLFEKVMNLFILQHGYNRRIIQQVGGENVFTADSYGEAAVTRSTLSPPVGGAMMDYHRRLVRRSDGDSYQPARSYEPTVILSSPTVHIMNHG